MKVTLLDGACADDGAAAHVRAALDTHALRQGWQLTRFFLTELDIAPCAGDFKCWVERPGMCAIGGVNHDVARAMADADLAVWLTPVTFGGYSYHLKKALDHLIQNISPLFTVVGGEVHHKARYASYPRLCAIGTERVRDEDGERVFVKLVERNAINMRAPSCRAMFAVDGQEADEIAGALRVTLADVSRGLA
jgi:multimeric flavodoxin WrbA